MIKTSIVLGIENKRLSERIDSLPLPDQDLLIDHGYPTFGDVKAQLDQLFLLFPRGGKVLTLAVRLCWLCEVYVIYTHRLDKLKSDADKADYRKALNLINRHINTTLSEIEEYISLCIEMDTLTSADQALSAYVASVIRCLMPYRFDNGEVIHDQTH